MIINDFEGDEQCFLLTFVEFWDYLIISILGEEIIQIKGGPRTLFLLLLSWQSN